MNQKACIYTISKICITDYCFWLPYLEDFTRAALEMFTIHLTQVLAKAGQVTYMHTQVNTHTEKYQVYNMAHLAQHVNE